jgi:hypothetical protein
MSKPTNEIAATRATLDNIMTVAPHRARLSSGAGVLARPVPVASPKIDAKALALYDDSAAIASCLSRKAGPDL